MTPRQRRMVFVALILVAVSAAAALTLTALRDNVAAFYDPTAIAAGKAPVTRAFRLGGMVEQGSVKRATGSMEVQFDVTDYRHEMTVRYHGVLPDLFREGQGVVARGQLVTNADGKQEFRAEEVLAKHDENYMPPEVAASLKQSHDQRRTPAP